MALSLLVSDICSCKTACPRWAKRWKTRSTPTCSRTSGRCDIYGWISIGGVKLNILFATNVFGLIFSWFAYDAIAKLCARSKINFMPEIYPGLSFFMYCSHYLVLKAVSIGLKRIDYVAAHQLFGYFARCILTVAICLLGYFAMAKWTPSLLGLLTGGRILRRVNGRS